MIFGKEYCNSSLQGICVVLVYNIPSFQRRIVYFLFRKTQAKCGKRNHLSLQTSVPGVGLECATLQFNDDGSPKYVKCNSKLMQRLIATYELRRTLCLSHIGSSAYI